MSQQETTAEFGRRLSQAVEAHPLGPAGLHGRQKWLLDKLKEEAGLKVSPNTVHKWMNGAARPREDNIRRIAKVLDVDELWLSTGRKPLLDPIAAEKAATAASGATLALAGLVEMTGGKITFAATREAPVSLWVNFGDRRAGVIVVTPQPGAEGAYVVPEPVGDRRIAGVVLASGRTTTLGVKILDLTDQARQTFGGFSVIQPSEEKPLRHLADLVP